MSRDITGALGETRTPLLIRSRTPTVHRFHLVKGVLSDQAVVYRSEPPTRCYLEAAGRGTGRSELWGSCS